MQKGLKTVLAAGAIAAIGATGLAGTAVAYDKHRGHGYQDGYDKHHGKGRHHRSFRGHGYDRLMDRFDANGDKELTQDELNAARQDLLKKHDGDANGDLTLEEFQMLWLEFMRKQMVRSFQHLDEDGNGVVTADEFIEPFSGAVSHMDRNDDGVLNSDDRRRGNKKKNKEKMQQEN